MECTRVIFGAAIVAFRQQPSFIFRLFDTPQHRKHVNSRTIAVHARDSDQCVLICVELAGNIVAEKCTYQDDTVTDTNFDGFSIGAPNYNETTAYSYDSDDLLSLWSVTDTAGRTKVQFFWLNDAKPPHQFDRRLTEI